jgi:hypothetical protein
MSDAIIVEWEKELRVLLDIIKTHPSSDLTQKRERVVVLQKLISERSKHPDA